MSQMILGGKKKYHKQNYYKYIRGLFRGAFFCSQITHVSAVELRNRNPTQ